MKQKLKNFFTKKYPYGKIGAGEITADVNWKTPFENWGGAIIGLIAALIFATWIYWAFGGSF